MAGQVRIGEKGVMGQVVPLPNAHQVPSIDQARALVAAIHRVMREHAGLTEEEWADRLAGAVCQRITAEQVRCWEDPAGEQPAVHVAVIMLMLAGPDAIGLAVDTLMKQLPHVAKPRSAPPHREMARTESVETLCADIMRACRARSCLDPEEFAEAVNRQSPRSPGVIGGAVRAWEAGVHAAPLDLVAAAMLVAGAPATKILSYMLMAVAS